MEIHATSTKLHQAQQQLEHESNCANCDTKDTKVSSLASLARCVLLCNATRRVKCFTRFTFSNWLISIPGNWSQDWEHKISSVRMCHDWPTTWDARICWHHFGNDFGSWCHAMYFSTHRSNLTTLKENWNEWGYEVSVYIYTVYYWHVPNDRDFFRN